jgi:WD40 repeat protein
LIALAFSHDGRSLAAAGGGLIPGATAIRVIDVATRTVRRRCHGHVMGVFQLDFDARTGLLASASHDYSVLLWEVDERNEALYLVGDADLGVSRNRVAFRDASVVIGDGMTFEGESAHLHTVDLETGATDVLLTLEGGRLGIDEMVVLPGGESIVVALDDMRHSGDNQQVCTVGRNGDVSTRWDPGGRLRGVAGLAPARFVAAVGSNPDGDEDEVEELVVFDAAKCARVASRILPGASFPPITLSPDRRFVLVGYAGKLETFDAETLEPGLFIELGDDEALSVAWSSAGVIAVGSFKTIRLFDAATGAEHLD